MSKKLLQQYEARLKLIFSCSLSWLQLLTHVIKKLGKGELYLYCSGASISLMEKQLGGQSLVGFLITLSWMDDVKCSGKEVGQFFFSIHDIIFNATLLFLR